MNNEINKNVLQYSEELQKMVQESEQKLLKIQNDKINNFKNDLNNISNKCISDIRLLINQTQSKVSSNLSKNKIDDTVLDEFQFNVQSIILQAKNDLDNYKNQFDINISDEVNEEIHKLKEFIKENHGTIEQELHDALYQINQSENSALTRLKETYDLGVETIVSAEKTALRNLKILSEELILKLEGKVEEVENVINEKLQNALDKIKEVEDEAISNITKFELTLKNMLEAEKDKIIEEVKQIVKDFEFTLSGYVEEMKAELNAHKDKLLEEIDSSKEEIIIELGKVENGIIERLFETEYEIIKTLNSLAQEIIAEIITVVDGYDLELEKIKEAKINEFIDAINLIKDEGIKEAIDVIDDLLAELNTATERHKSELFNETAKHLLALRNQYLALVDEFKVMVNQEKDKFFDEITEHSKILDEHTEKLKEKLNEHKDNLKEEMNVHKEELVEESKEEIKGFIDKYRENVFTTELAAGETVIKIQPSDMVLNMSAKVYFDGILQIIRKHYTVDFLTNSVILLQPFEYKIDVLILQNLPVTDLPKREATDKEIDDLFIDPYRLGTDKDIDGLYVMKPASDNDVDSLFN